MTPGVTRRALLALAGLPFAAHAQPAPPPEVAAGVPQARLLGSGTLRFFGLQVYDARLWVGPRFDADAPAAAPLGLELEYARALAGHRIAERSLVEMKRVDGIGPEQAERWLEAMRSLFPDVQPGDRLTAINRPGEGLHFHLNATPIGALREVEFARRFIAIWLGPQTSEPALRRLLLGRAA